MTTTPDHEAPEATAPIDPARGCPVIDFDFTVERPALEYFTFLDELREQAPIAWNTYGGGFWMLNRNAMVGEAFQTPEVFSSSATVPTIPEPDYHFIPTMENGAEHRKYRAVLNPQFSPKVVATLESSIRQDCIDLIDSLVEKGSVDLVADFAMVFPTKVFLQIVDLPAEDTDTFVTWVEDVFAGLGNAAKADGMAAAMEGIRVYFTTFMEEWRANPGDPATSFFGRLLESNIGDRPIRDDEFLNMSLVLLLAGLDTVKSQMGYMFFHLATHPEDRQRIIDEPEIAPAAVEEFLRANAIVMDGRKLAQDVDFHGCPMKKGDMVMLTLAAASRDTTDFDHADQIDFDRKAVTHFSFGSGPHRCLGSHLARLELRVVLEEWHKRIPHYKLDPSVAREDIVESGPQLGLSSLPLVWEV
jgi:cytochrome P450